MSSFAMFCTMHVYQKSNDNFLHTIIFHFQIYNDHNNFLITTLQLIYNKKSYEQMQSSHE